MVGCLLFVRDKLLYLLDIGGVGNRSLAKISLTLGVLLGKDVRLVCVCTYRLTVFDSLKRFLAPL